MENPIKIKKEYQLKNDYQTLKANHREQVLLLFTLHKLSGDTGKKLIDSYLNAIIPITVKSKEPRYSTITSHRCKRREHLNHLLNNYFTLN
ncbi:hypothetical protein [Salinimicrobium sp. GXAS 041]|uniref:hypothetical protein n=1 Tax=Salinimicrobium sp. GXAS 041 TaxID=3400806 RepID=UPI003C74972C